MNWIDIRSQVNECVTIGSCMRINCLLFEDDLLLLASFQHGNQQALDWFSVACDQAGMKISTKNTQVLPYYVSRETQDNLCCK